MPDNSSLDGQSRSRRTARPYVLAVVAIAVLIALVVAIAQPRETREGARSNVAPDAPVVADTTPGAPADAATDGDGRGTREMPDAGPPLDAGRPAPR